MFGSVVLDVAIGLSLLFLFVSLISAAIREAIEMVLRSRAADLERGMRALLGDPDGTGWARAMYGHPLVCPLATRRYAPERLRARRRLPVRDRSGLPSYIPAPAFAAALLDLAMRGPVGAAAATGPAAPFSSAALLGHAAAMPDGPVRRVLQAALDASQGDPGRIRLEIELWFENAMRRVSDGYRRRTRCILLVIGLGIAALMNIDAFSVGKALFVDKALRDGAVMQAASLLPHGTNGDVQSAAAQGFASLQDELDRIRFPTGWGDPPPQRLRHAGPNGRPGALDLWAVARMLAGWLVTGFSVMLGAPFWFDMLNRFTMARSAIKPPG